MFAAKMPKIFQFVIVANKCDLEDQRKVVASEAWECAKVWGLPFFEVSAKTNVSVIEAIQALIVVMQRKEEENYNTNKR